MTPAASLTLPAVRPPSLAAPAAGPWLQFAALAAIAVALLSHATPPVALIAGLLFAVFIGHPFPRWNHLAAKSLLQFCVVLLGFSMDLPTVLRLGLHGSLFAAGTIALTLLLGIWLGRRLNLGRNIVALIAIGTAICGGSAIAAVSSVLAATEAEIAVSIGAIFLLNAVALCLFPLIGHLLYLSQPQFGVWAGVAIQDISSVVGAGASYGPHALATATAVKLSRTLWIIPLTSALAFGLRRGCQNAVLPSAKLSGHAQTAVPWFIGLFLLASLAHSYVPAVSSWSPYTSAVAGRGMILALFLIGTSLSVRALRAVGWRAIALGLILWIVLSVASLLAVYALPPS